MYVTRKLYKKNVYHTLFILELCVVDILTDSYFLERFHYKLNTVMIFIHNVGMCLFVISPYIVIQSWKGFFYVM